MVGGYFFLYVRRILLVREAFLFLFVTNLIAILALHSCSFSLFPVLGLWCTLTFRVPLVARLMHSAWITSACVFPHVLTLKPGLLPTVHTSHNQAFNSPKVNICIY